MGSRQRTVRWSPHKEKAGIHAIFTNWRITRQFNRCLHTRYGKILHSLHRRRVPTNYAVTRVGSMSWRVLSHFKGEHAVAGGCSHTSKENAHTPRAEAQLLTISPPRQRRNNIYASNVQSPQRKSLSKNMQEEKGDSFSSRN